MSAWLLRGVRRYPGDSGERHDLRIDDGVISSWSDAGRGDATGATVIDLDGNWILPAFADSHLHLLYSIEHSRQHDLAGLSLEEIDGLLADASDGTDSISFVGHGWKDPLPAQMQPDPRRHLDGSIRDVPVFLWNADHHRPTSAAIPDLLACSEADLFQDRKESTIVLRGPQGRIHIFTATGRHITSAIYSSESIQTRIARSRWILLGDVKARAFIERVNRSIPDSEPGRPASDAS